MRRTRQRVHSSGRLGRPRAHPRGGGALSLALKAGGEGCASSQLRRRGISPANSTQLFDTASNGHAQSTQNCARITPMCLKFMGARARSRTHSPAPDGVGTLVTMRRLSVRFGSLISATNVDNRLQTSSPRLIVLVSCARARRHVARVAHAPSHPPCACVQLNAGQLLDRDHTVREETPS